MNKLTADKLEMRMKNPLAGAPKLIPRIPEIMYYVQAGAAPAPSALPQLPSGWEYAFDTKQGKFCYKHTPTGKATWKTPIMIPKELAKWVKMVTMQKIKEDKLEMRMKNPMVGAPKLIPRIPEIMALVAKKNAMDAEFPPPGRRRLCDGPVLEVAQ